MHSLRLLWLFWSQDLKPTPPKSVCLRPCPKRVPSLDLVTWPAGLTRLFWLMCPEAEEKQRGAWLASKGRAVYPRAASPPVPSLSSYPPLCGLKSLCPHFGGMCAPVCLCVICSQIRMQTSVRMCGGQRRVLGVLFTHTAYYLEVRSLKKESITAKPQHPSGSASHGSGRLFYVDLNSGPYA